MKQGKIRGEGRRAQPVVGIQEGNEFAARCRHPGVTCSGQTLVFLADIVDVVISTNNTFGIVRRPIVHNEDLIRLCGLVADAVDRFGKEPRMIVGRDDN